MSNTFVPLLLEQRITCCSSCGFIKSHDMSLISWKEQIGIFASNLGNLRNLANERNPRRAYATPAGRQGGRGAVITGDTTLISRSNAVIPSGKKLSELYE